ncbi:acetylcholinesterase collagenic tail peptide-like isoform X2 [Cololabis saira]|uniref:acetylcholinesterase collagenic tail peptide-like isoform X2 n=1 Tax=Cololabis saira TaxID=129043 RepID=UPI002AD54D5F|nr:acetylcholinesterase collagenic tail peptide-like isoform X2 [Cololabis saira]XP_061580568.1 acetylcholinesterase collagenic tail peptide-like isoform X2 [Cololabis saira]
MRGEQGSRGETGARGSMGLKGSRGPTGKLGRPGPSGLPGSTGKPGLAGQVFVLPGLQGDPGNRGPTAACSCSDVQTTQTPPDKIQAVFVADGEKEMRRLRAENVMVLRTDRRALYIYAQSQWINVLENRRHRLPLTFKHD